MRKMTLIELLDEFGTNVAKEFVDSEGRLSEDDTKILRRTGELFERLAEIADSNREFDCIKECLEESTTKGES